LARVSFVYFCVSEADVSRSRFVAALFLSCTLLASGAAQAGTVAERQRSSERTPYTAQEAVAAVPLDMAGVRFFGDDPEAFRAALAGAPGSSEPWLVLSGGGENGAYGAGVLNGWTKAGTRPTFGVVTGVSTGALIAPFAFAGPDFDAALKAAYTTITAADIFEVGNNGESLLDTWPMSKMIERFVTPEVVAAVARGHEEGRRLYVVTTHVDLQRPVVWDMGAIARRGEAGLKLFRQVLLASASIPGAFPPVPIDAEAGDKRFQELHADGGVTGQFFLAPEAMLLAGRGGLPTDKAYVIVNYSLRPDFQVTQRTTITLLGRSMAAAIRSATRATIAASATFGRRAGVDIAFAHVDERFTKTTAKAFDTRYMQELFAFGEATGRDGSAFRRDPLGGENRTVAGR
jgi:hypothetical protein